MFKIIIYIYIGIMVTYESILANKQGVKDLYNDAAHPIVLESVDNISTVDSRHAIITNDLKGYFSEFALHNYRCKVEIMHLIQMSDFEGFQHPVELSSQEKENLYKLLIHFNKEEAKKIVQYDHFGRNGLPPTEHDVKSVEYYIKEKLSELGLSHLHQFVHIYCTSEDINNIAYACMLKDGFNYVLLPKLRGILSYFSELIQEHSHTPMMARTHGQPASPTTFGKEIAVYTNRIINYLEKLDQLVLSVKFNGAVGNYNSHILAQPNVDRMKYSSTLAEKFGFKVDELTNQRGPMTEIIVFFQIIKNINSVLIDFCQDMRSYNKDGLVYHSNIAGEIGSSVMPQKVNPWFLEEAEGFLKMSNALLDFFASSNDISRLQRDMTGHPHERNYGDALGHTLIARTNILESLSRIKVDKQKTEQELDNHLEVVTEGIQSVLRREGCADAYELLKEYVRGITLKKTGNDNPIRNFIEVLGIDDESILLQNEKYNTVVEAIKDKEKQKTLINMKLPENVIQELLFITDPKQFIGIAPTLAEKTNEKLISFMNNFDNKITLSKKNRIHGLFFDFDNTLQLGDKEELLIRMQSIITELHEKNNLQEEQKITESDIKTICSFSDYREMVQYIAKKTSISEDDIKKINNEVTGKFDHIFHLDTMSPELLRLAKTYHIPVSIISTRGNQSLTRLITSTHNINNEINLFLGRNDVQEKKPSPEGIIKSINTLGLQKEKNAIYYIGDKFHEDVQAALNAGVTPIYIKRVNEDIEKNQYDKFLKNNGLSFINISELFEYLIKKIL